MASMADTQTLNTQRNIPSYKLNLRDKDDLVAFVRRIEDASSTLLEPWSRRAYRNLQWAAGFHMNTWKMGIPDPRFDLDSPIPTIYTNWLRLYLKLFIARVIESPTTWRGFPSRSSDVSDVGSAKTISKLLGYSWEQLNIDDHDNLPSAMRMLAVTGMTFAHPSWEHQGEEPQVVSAAEMRSKINAFLSQNPDQRDRSESEVLNEMLMQEYGATADEFEFNDDGLMVIRQGKGKLEFFDGFSVTEDLSAPRFQDGDFISIRIATSVAKARELYPNNADDIKGEPVATYGFGDTKKREELKNEGSGSAFEMVIIHRFFHRRTKIYKNGIWSDIIGHKVMDRIQDNPYDDGDVPAVQMVESPENDQVRPTCTFDDLVVLNAAINQIDQQLVSHINKTVDPGWLIEDGSADEKEFARTITGPTVTTYNPIKNPPLPKPIHTVAAHVLIEKRALIEQLKEIAGLSDPNIGRPSGKATSGRAIIALQETADRLSIISLKFVEVGLAQLGRRFIHLWHQHESAERMFRITGQDGKQDVLSLKGVSFMAQSENKGRAAIELWDVEVTIAAKLSEESIRERITWLLDRQILHPERDRAIIVQALAERRMPDIDIARPDRENAIQENEYVRQMSDSMKKEEAKPEQIMQTLAATVSRRPGDNDIAHLVEHYTLTKSEDWRMLHGQMRDYLQGHIAEHQENLNRAVMAQQEQEQPKPAASKSSGRNGK